LVYHALNRAVARLPLLQKEGDFDSFERIMHEAMERHPIRLLAYCLMPNHWHMVLWPRTDGEMTRFLRWMTHTHTMRWHAHYHSSGTGHVYQGRFKSFPVQIDAEDLHLLRTCRYVERNALRAGLVQRAEQWQWSSLWRREWGTPQQRGLLAEWPMSRPVDWIELVNAPQTEAEMEVLRRSVRRGTPFGDAHWQHRVAVELGLQATLRPQGRPRRRPQAAAPSPSPLSSE
jgi:putative transposase